jgi:hypothetical protein
MKNKSKIVRVLIIAGAVLIVVLLLWNGPQQSEKLEYTIVELSEGDISENRTCLMIYWDEVIAYYDTDTGEYNIPVDISVKTEKPESPAGAVDIWANNVGKLGRIYKDATERYQFYHELYGNFSWSDRPDIIQIKYRTTREGYSRDGWYIFTESPLPSGGGSDYGEFFLSGKGVLMPAERATSLENCP